MDTSISQHVLNIQENGFMSLRMESPVDIEWEKTMHSGHDAFYIIRKRALLLDLWNMELPCETYASYSSLSKEEEISKNYKDYSQKEFLKEICEDTELWYADENLPFKKDNSWQWDCPATIQ